MNWIKLEVSTNKKGEPLVLLYLNLDNVAAFTVQQPEGSFPGMVTTITGSVRPLPPEATKLLQQAIEDEIARDLDEEAEREPIIDHDLFGEKAG